MTSFEQIERIRQMEEKFDIVRKTVSELNDSFDNFLAVQSIVNELSDYYSGKEWLADYDADCNGELPQDLKRGVLSQDAVYNLLCENEEIIKLLNYLSKTQENNYGKNEK